MPVDVLEVLRQHARIDLSAVTHWVPDVGPPSAARPLDFSLHVSAGSLSYFSSDVPRHAPLDPGRARRLREAAEAALSDGDQSYGVDTAIGRFYTYLTLTVFDPTDPERGLRSACLSLNHHGGEEIYDAGWASLIVEASGLVGRFLGSYDLRCWVGLIERLPPAPPLPAPYEQGKAVRCPDDAVLLLPFDGSLFLRVGQPPGPSNLIELRRGEGHVDVLLRDAGQVRLARIEPPRRLDPRLEAPVPSLSNLDLLELDMPGPSYRGELGPPLDALRGDESLQFQIFFVDPRRVVLAVLRPPLGLYAQRPGP